MIYAAAAKTGSHACRAVFARASVLTRAVDAGHLVGEMSIEAGARVNDEFVLEHEIGRGGMGAVWAARREGGDARCAVKVIAAEMAHDPHVRARFEREAQAMTKIRNPHVVQILEHGTWEGHLFIAMELLEGESLAERLMRRRRLPVGEVLQIVNACAEALTAVHAADVVHRDLKPSNILLENTPDGDHVKLCDLGVAKADDSTGLETKSGSLLGTPYYMSPEQMDSPRSVDARADLWALAVITYECVTGVRPFEAEQLSRVINAVVHSQSRDPSSLADVPEAFDAWWRRATHRRIERRFADAKELAAGLATALETASSRRAPEPAPRGVSSTSAAMKGPATNGSDERDATSRPARPPWKLAALAGLVLVLGFGASRIDRDAPLPTRAAVPPAPPPSQRCRRGSAPAPLPPSQRRRGMMSRRPTGPGPLRRQMRFPRRHHHSHPRRRTRWPCRPRWIPARG